MQLTPAIHYEGRRRNVESTLVRGSSSSILCTSWPICSRRFAQFIRLRRRMLHTTRTDHPLVASVRCYMSAPSTTPLSSRSHLGPPLSSRLLTFSLPPTCSSLLSRSFSSFFFFFLNNRPPPEFSPLPLHAPFPI